MEQSTWDSLLNTPVHGPENGGGAAPVSPASVSPAPVSPAPVPSASVSPTPVPAFSIEQVEKIAPEKPFDKLRYMAQDKIAKRDKFSLDAIGTRLEDEINRRNGSA
jgi:hypothetical protein